MITERSLSVNFPSSTNSLTIPAAASVLCILAIFASAETPGTPSKGFNNGFN